jgi:hypothetical protein
MEELLKNNNIIKKYNVESYSLSDNYLEWNILYNENTENTENTENVYFIIENQQGSDAFAHWCFESAIYLFIFIELKKFYPNAKLLLKSIKNFKKLFIEKLGISLNDVCIEHNYENICFFSTPTSLNEKSCDQYYKSCVDNFCKIFDYDYIGGKKEIVMLPRQKLENFKPNDREYHTGVLENELLKKDHTILHTDQIKDINTQINIIKSHKNIILTDGSPFFVNGIFAKNSNIIIIGNTTPWQISTFPKLAYIVKKILDNGNNYRYSTGNDIIF